MAIQIRIFRSSGTFVAPNNFPLSGVIHLFGGGQAGFRGGYRTDPNGILAGGIGGKGADYAAYTNALIAGKTVSIVLGAGGDDGNGEAGADTTIEIDSSIVARARGGASSTPASIGTTTNQGGDGGDPSLCNSPPSGVVVPALWGGGGGGCAGPTGRGGHGGIMPNYVVTFAFMDAWFQFASGPLTGKWTNGFQNAGNGAGVLGKSGGGAADGGDFVGNGVVSPSLDACLVTNNSTTWAGNGGNAHNIDRGSFFTVQGVPGPFYPNRGASAPQGTHPRDDSSVYAYGGDGHQYQASNNSGVTLKAGSFANRMGIDASVPDYDQAGPGCGASSPGGTYFNAIYGPGPGAISADVRNRNGYDGGLFGGGGSGGNSVWDFGGNNYDFFTHEGGSGGDGGVIIMWDDSGPPLVGIPPDIIVEPCPPAMEDGPIAVDVSGCECP